MDIIHVYDILPIKMANHKGIPDYSVHNNLQIGTDGFCDKCGVKKISKSKSELVHESVSSFSGWNGYGDVYETTVTFFCPKCYGGCIFCGKLADQEDCLDYFGVKFNINKLVCKKCITKYNPSTDDKYYIFSVESNSWDYAYKNKCKKCDKDSLSLKKIEDMYCVSCNPSDDHNKYEYNTNKSTYIIKKSKIYNEQTKRHYWKNNDKAHYKCSQCYKT